MEMGGYNQSLPAYGIDPNRLQPASQCIGPAWKQRIVTGKGQLHLLFNQIEKNEKMAE